jgi:hypothetical protein
MAIGLGDIYEKLKELVTITDKVRENTERIVKLEEKVDTIRMDMVEIRGDIKIILNRLDMKEEISTLKAQLAEHIEACEKAKA